MFLPILEANVWNVYPGLSKSDFFFDFFFFFFLGAVQKFCFKNSMHYAHRSKVGCLNPPPGILPSLSHPHIV